MQSSLPPPLGFADLYALVETHGHDPTSLPALRQYRDSQESGNLEAVRRIEANLLDFLRGLPPARMT